MKRVDLSSPGPGFQREAPLDYSFSKRLCSLGTFGNEVTNKQNTLNQQGEAGPFEEIGKEKAQSESQGN